MIYLDNAATTLKKPESVIDAVVSALRTMGNSSRGTHESSLATSRTVFETRMKIAEFFAAAYVSLDYRDFDVGFDEKISQIVSAGAASDDQRTPYGSRVESDQSEEVRVILTGRNIGDDVSGLKLE